MTATATRFARIDLSRLPPPPVLEVLDYEAIRAEILADLVAAAPDLADVIGLESEPLVKLVEIIAYRELGLRGRINDAAKACMLAFATGGDLDHLAALFGVKRLLIDPGDPTAVPPVAPTLEDDMGFRARTQLALEGQSVAGPEGAYLFHTLSAHGQVKDASVTSPNPGEVVVAVLSTEGDGTPGQAVLDTVTAALDLARPLTDQLTVQAAAILPYSVEASLTILPGPDPQLVQDAAQAALEAFADRQHGLGRDITIAGLHAALFVEGVQNVELTEPAADLAVDDLSAAHCTAIALAFGGIDV
ncbi:MAG: baseplate J/gp47 family protein [Rhodobacter sp.]|nr:baseplate J/gp47 family protein [Rhodobacter sp.]